MLKYDEIFPSNPNRIRRKFPRRIGHVVPSVSANVHDVVPSGAADHFGISIMIPFFIDVPEYEIELSHASRSTNALCVHVPVSKAAADKRKVFHSF